MRRLARIIRCVVYAGFVGNMGMLSACLPNSQEASIEQILAGMTEQKDDFIAAKYRTVKPLAQLINVANYSEQTQSFSIEREQDVQIYGVGEIVYNLSDQQKRYYLLNDDIELYFASGEAGTQLETQSRSYTYTYVNAEELEQESVLFKQYEPKEKKSIYKTLKRLIEVQVPLRNLNVDNPLVGRTLRFDVGIGDNDDEFMQKSKVVWHSHVDNMSQTPRDFGYLRLLNQATAARLCRDTMASVFASPVIDGNPDSVWATVPAYEIEHVVYGFNKDKEDLSARVKSCWDKQNLYFLIEISDSRKKYIPKEQLSDRELLVDYGWVENAQGKTIWKMTTKNSRHAGGALKNQKIDTLLHLAAGTYTVNYTSDESHAYQNWDSDPPKMPFYGIVVYAAK